jgi:hypothetical protein
MVSAATLGDASGLFFCRSDQLRLRKSRNDPARRSANGDSSEGSAMALLLLPLKLLDLGVQYNCNVVLGKTAILAMAPGCCQYDKHMQFSLKLINCQAREDHLRTFKQKL